MKVKLSRGIAHSADSPIPPQNNCFLQEKKTVLQICVQSTSCQWAGHSQAESYLVN